MNIDQIINKVRYTGQNNKNSSDVSYKYLNNSYLSNKDPHIANYQLQVQNSQLSQKVKRLSKLLKSKEYKIKANQNLSNSIENIKKQLRDILNLNQSLELSLSKVRLACYEDSHTSRSNNDNSISSRSCRCSKNTKRQMVSQIENGLKEKQCQIFGQGKDSKVFLRSPEKVKISKELQAIKFEQFGAQTHFYDENRRKNIGQKERHIKRLKQILQKQVGVMNNYDAKINKQLKVGQIKKVENQDKHYLKTCPSAGTIVKIKKTHF